MTKQHFQWDKVRKKDGFFVSKKNSDLKYLNFNFLPLSKKRSFQFHNNEALLTLLRGKIEIKIAGSRKRFVLGPRRDVFSKKAFSFYAAPGTSITIKPLMKSEVIIAKAGAHRSKGSFLIKPNNVVVKSVGKSTYSRKVHHILRENQPAQVLIAGETFNEPGKWSSYPPHKHDKNNYPKETQLEEVYFFKVKPENKFGIMRLYGKHKGKLHDQTIVVRNNDCVVIPFGYHPVCAAPDTKLYYFWALAGKKRKLRFQPDPAFI